MTARTSQGLYPELPPTPPAAQPSAPPLDQGYGGSSGLSSSSDSGDSRGLILPNSESPFQRNVRMRGVTVKEEEIDLEAISCLLDFTSRDITTQTQEQPLVNTFRTSTPNTPAAAPRPDRPPMITSRRILPTHIARPRPLSYPPAAALGAQRRTERGNSNRDSPMEELPDIPDTPASPAVSDILVLRLVFFFLKRYCVFFFRVTFFPYINFFYFSTLSSGGYSEGPMAFTSDEEMSEYEYGDPYEGEGPYSTTPPPVFDHPSHEVCVPPAWVEPIPGSQVTCRCLLCHEDNLHHAIRCIQCRNAPGCCRCI